MCVEVNDTLLCYVTPDKADFGPVNDFPSPGEKWVVA